MYMYVCMWMETMCFFLSPGYCLKQIFSYSLRNKWIQQVVVRQKMLRIIFQANDFDNLFFWRHNKENPTFYKYKMLSHVFLFIQKKIKLVFGMFGWQWKFVKKVKIYFNVENSFVLVYSFTGYTIWATKWFCCINLYSILKKRSFTIWASG